MRKRLLTLLFTLVAVLSAGAADMEWIDITSKYVVNPDFNNDDITTGWSGTPWGAANPKENAEHYQKNYDTYQTISGLPAGKYRVSMKGFYRMGSASDDASYYGSGNYSSRQYAKLYAKSSTGTFTSSIVPLSSGATGGSYGGSTQWVNISGSWKMVPDNMVAAANWFAGGNYDNSVECEVGSDGILTIGVSKNTTVNGDWTCVDQWRLEYWGIPVKVTSVTFSQLRTNMVVSEKRTLTATVLPEDASVTTLKWASSNTNAVTIDDNGIATAVAKGTTTITATADDGSGKYAQMIITVGDPVAPTAANLIINEVMAANVDVYRDPSTNFGSWVELYNPTEDAVKLGGLIVTLTDGDGNKTSSKLIDSYGILTAGGYAILNFDHYDQFTEYSFRQINGKLDCDGGVITISNAAGEVLSTYEYPAAISRMSYARTTDGGTSWAWSGNPTPGSTNRYGQYASTQLAAPVVDTPSQMFSGSLTVNVTIPSGCTLRYTTDGTAPALGNGEISETGVFEVTESSCYRFRFFHYGYLPSKVVTRTFIKNTGAEPFPIVSLVSYRGNIFDNDYAIFSKSKYGRAGHGQDATCNWNMDWDRPVNFEYITPDNKCVFSQEVDLSACGGWSRAWSPHSFKLKAGKIYDGLNSMDYQFFPDEKPFLKHKTLQIRNGGNDNTCRIKDAALQQIIGRSGVYVEHQSWQPVHVYVNAQPYAVLNMREPNNKHYGYTNYGIDTDQMDQFEICPDSGYVQMTGTKAAFTRLYNYCKTPNSPSSYSAIKKLLDIDEYANYMAAELYLGNWDWPQNNVKGFRDAIDGKFRFVLFDLDGSFSTSTPLTTFAGKQNYSFDNLRGYDYILGQSIQGTSRSGEIEFVTIFLNLLKNADFKKKFVDAYCLMAGSVFEPTRVNTIVDEMASYLSQGNYVDPSGTANTIKSSLANRQTTLINHLKSYLSLGTPKTVKLSSNISGAGILLNGMQVPTGQFDGQLFAPTVLKAEAPAGYQFLGWKDAESSDTRSVSVFAKDTPWKYYQVDLDALNWKASEFDDNTWPSGKAPLGYGKTQNTVLTSNRATYYFRKTFTLDELKESDTFTLDYVLDDGCVVYVNGEEVGRDNMPSGSINASTLATTYAYNNPNTGTMTIPGSMFRQGTNVIAVEVHNNNTSSSDILWNAELIRKTIDDSGNKYLATTPEFTLPTTASSYNLQAVWKKMDAEDQVLKRNVPVKINELSAGNASFVNEYFKKDDWVELYNTTDYDLNCTGLYLSDNALKPTKYMIQPNAEKQTNVVIPAHGKLLVWCSKKTTAEQIHATFKLANADGSLLMLSSSDVFEANNKAYFKDHPEMTAFTDTLYYNAHDADQSVGRYPDGGNSYYVFNHATINTANTLQTSDIFVAKDVFGIKEILGDANADGIVDMEDAKAVMRSFLGLGTVHFPNADVNKDGKITIADANAIILMIQQE